MEMILDLRLWFKSYRARYNDHRFAIEDMSHDRYRLSRA